MDEKEESTFFRSAKRRAGNMKNEEKMRLHEKKSENLLDKYWEI